MAVTPAAVYQVADRILHMPATAALVELSRIFDLPKSMDGHDQAEQLHFNALLATAIRQAEEADA